MEIIGENLGSTRDFSLVQQEEQDCLEAEARSQLLFTAKS